jgi:hemolysin activation/secretion protein
LGYSPREIMLNQKVWPLAILALSQSVLAIQPPSAGSQLQQIPSSPIPQKQQPIISLVPSDPAATPQSDNVKINVKSLKITGMQAYSEAELLKLTHFKPNSELSLSDLREMAASIANYYHKNGYFVAQAYLPTQDIENGIVTLAVIEGQYGKVLVRNQTNLSNSLVASQLKGINSGDTITNVPLESRLLLLSDIAGVNVSSTLAPGATAGTSDLIVDVSPAQRITGSIDADNAGNRYTGENRIGATMNVNNLAGHGDIASLRVLTSGKGLNYARAAYQMQFAKATAGVAYSWLEYELDKEFKVLDAHGDAKIASIYGSYPLIRSRNNNLYADLLYENKILQDRIDAISMVTDKKVNALTAALRGNYLDNLGGGGLNSYSVAATFGDLNIQTPAAYAVDESTARSNGHYNKLALSANRLQRVTNTVSLYAGFNGQLASKNLDNSEKMGLGGMNAVRAYPEGEAYGDQGYVLTVEVRRDLPKFYDQIPGQMQLVGFIDTGRVNTDKTTWTNEDNTRTLSGAGVGINWMDYNNFAMKLAYAHKLGSEKAISAPDKSGRFWVQLVKYF